MTDYSLIDAAKQITVDENNRRQAVVNVVREKKGLVRDGDSTDLRFAVITHIIEFRSADAQLHFCAGMEDSHFPLRPIIIDEDGLPVVLAQTVGGPVDARDCQLVDACKNYRGPGVMVALNLVGEKYHERMQRWADVFRSRPRREGDDDLRGLGLVAPLAKNVLLDINRTEPDAIAVDDWLKEHAPEAHKGDDEVAIEKEFWNAQAAMQNRAAILAAVYATDGKVADGHTGKETQIDFLVEFKNHSGQVLMCAAYADQHCCLNAVVLDSARRPQLSTCSMGGNIPPIDPAVGEVFPPYKGLGTIVAVHCVRQTHLNTVELTSKYAFRRESLYHHFGTAQMVSEMLGEISQGARITHLIEVMLPDRVRAMCIGVEGQDNPFGILSRPVVQFFHGEIQWKIDTLLGERLKAEGRTMEEAVKDYQGNLVILSVIDVRSPINRMTDAAPTDEPEPVWVERPHDPGLDGDELNPLPEGVQLNRNPRLTPKQ